MLEDEFIEQAIFDAAKGKKKRKRVQRILSNPQPTLDLIKTTLADGTWEPPNHQAIKLREGAHRKERAIQKPQFKTEQIIHHMLVDRLRPILEPKFYEWSCGSVPGKGPLLVKNIMQHWIKQYGDQTIYVAELDIKKFYQNVDTEVLKSQLSHFIKDDRFLSILFKVIDGTAPGLPLGFYTSPWLANLYLTPLDRHILHTLHPDHYARYMDNLFLFSTNKSELHTMVDSVKAFCHEQLHVEIKKNWQVYQFEKERPDGSISGRAINCLGYVIHNDRTTLRKSLLRRIRSKGNRMHKHGTIKLMDARAMASYSGWLEHTDTYNYYCRWIKSNVSFCYCREMISKDAKWSNKYDRLEKNLQQRKDETK